MLSFFKTTGKPGAGKETSFHAEIAERERELGDRSTDMTRAETIVEELDEVRLTFENSLACSEVFNSKLMPRIQDKRDKGYCLSVLVQACRERGILPESCKISGIELKQEQIVGVVADITMGKRGQEDICVKIFRQYQDADREKIKKVSGTVLCKSVALPLGYPRRSTIAQCGGSIFRIPTCCPS